MRSRTLAPKPSCSHFMFLLLGLSPHPINRRPFCASCHVSTGATPTAAGIQEPRGFEQPGLPASGQGRRALTAQLGRGRFRTTWAAAWKLNQGLQNRGAAGREAERAACPVRGCGHSAPPESRALGTRAAPDARRGEAPRVSAQGSRTMCRSPPPPEWSAPALAVQNGFSLG